MAEYRISLSDNLEVIPFGKLPTNEAFWLYESRYNNGTPHESGSNIIVGFKTSNNTAGYNAFYITKNNITPVFVASDYLVSHCKEMNIIIKVR